MDKAYNHKDHEEKIYSLWETEDIFKASEKGKPYTILMPPPNANASLHAGHAMYTIDDILIRWKRMQGFSAVWIPGMDHAGFETQFVYEKHLAKEGKSRLDFDRQTLYDNIFNFTKENSGLIFTQMKRLGFSADWSRSVYTLDDHVIKQVFETFKKMESEGLVYRDSYIVNYCTHCGTSLAELEVKHIERQDPLYFVRYPKVEEDGYVVVATVRPEPIFIDTHLAVNPKDKKNAHLIGTKVKNPLTDVEMEIIGDEYVDPEFGTGVVKLTPGHDPNDFEVAKKYNLPILQAIDWTGRIMDNGGKYAGLKIKAAREKVVADLQQKGLIEKVDENYTHSVITCYKCGHDLEPLTVPNWFIKVEKLKQRVRTVVDEDKVIFHPHKYKRHMLSWLDIMHDWPISRQIVWGIRIPIWYEVDPKASNLYVWWLDKDKQLQKGSVRQFLEKGVTVDEIKSGLQKVQALTGEAQPKYVISQDEPSMGMYLPETDTFDTWFSSSQWPIVTLKDDEFSTRYPTDVMGTLSDILRFWISRMILFGLYLKNEIPYKHVYLWSMVADSKGQKMSKSKGNVINPIDLIDKYGADALRMSLVYGTPAGSKVILSDDKVRGMRNFSNKIWNMGRFINMMFTDFGKEIPFFDDSIAITSEDKQLIAKLDELVVLVTKSLEKFRFSDAVEGIYQFMWHELADIYIEQVKDRTDKEVALSVLRHAYFTSLKLLHPFMPFVTETVWQELKHLRKHNQLLASSVWPE